MVALAGGGFDQHHEAELRARLRFPPDPVAIDADPARPVTSWTLARIRATVTWLQPYSLSGVWRLLRRWGIRLRRGRPQQFSPDPAYAAKEARLLAAVREAGQRPAQTVVLFGDEFTYYRWPLPGRTWAPRTGPPPRATRSAPGNQRFRVVAALDGTSGQVHYRQRSRMGREQLIPFLRQLETAYADAERVILVLDNWPAHHQPAVQAAVAALPRLELLFLPTYAPWLNPIEKLWAWLKEAVLRMHQQAADWPQLRAEVAAFLDSFADGSEPLLRRVGLRGTGTLASALHPPPTDLERQT